MDMWYFNRQNTAHIEDLGRDWVAGCKSNRLSLTPKGWKPIVTWLETVPRCKFSENAIQTGGGEHRFWVYAKNVARKGHLRIRLVAFYGGGAKLSDWKELKTMHQMEIT